MPKHIPKFRVRIFRGEFNNREGVGTRLPRSNDWNVVLDGPEKLNMLFFDSEVVTLKELPPEQTAHRMPLKRRKAQQLTTLIKELARQYCNGSQEELHKRVADGSIARSKGIGPKKLTELENYFGVETTYEATKCEHCGEWKYARRKNNDNKR